MLRILRLVSRPKHNLYIIKAKMEILVTGRLRNYLSGSAFFFVVFVKT